MSVFGAVIFALVTAGAVAFQIALALGAPWGSYAMGGRFPGRFPTRMRVAALIQAGLLVLLALVVLSDALVIPSVSQTIPTLVWLPVGFSGVSLLVNAISPSAGERRIWVPVAVVMLVSSLIVAVS